MCPWHEGNLCKLTIWLVIVFPDSFFPIYITNSNIWNNFRFFAYLSDSVGKIQFCRNYLSEGIFEVRELFMKISRALKDKIYKKFQNFQND